MSEDNKLGVMNNDKDVCFEEALGKLELIVKRLEKGELSLEATLEQFAQGVSLSQLCLAKLNAAEQRVHTILREEGSFLIESPLKLGEE